MMILPKIADFQPGVVSYFFGRTMSWCGRMTQLMIVLMYFRQSPEAWWWMVALVLIPFLVYAEWRWLFPQETRYIFKKSGMFKEDK
jgi:hypothetical protein